ncbi:MAG TPA: peptide deformylase [bacterium]|nr:peptide deformylase [bacterium]
MLEIVKYPDPLLRKQSEKVLTYNANLLELLEEMTDTMYIADGVGLAAPQIGVSKQIIVLDAGDGPMVLINPVVTVPEDTAYAAIEEGCLSLPDIRVDVTRPSRIHLAARDEKGNPLSFDADGLLARVIQHEQDHLNGVLIIDYLSSIQRQLLRSKLRSLEKLYSGAV